MANAYTPTIPSGSTNGRPIKLASSATLLHTCTNVAGEMDEVSVYVHNQHTADVTVTIEVDDNTAVDDEVTEFTIAPNSGLVLCVPGLRFNGGTTIEAKGSVADVVTASVIVNNIDTNA